MSYPTASFLQVIVRVQGLPPEVTFAVQRGRSELLPPFEARSGSVAFAFTLGLAAPYEGREFNFLGEYAQGPAADRFVYLNAGTLAGQRESCWERRAKLKLASAPAALVRLVVNEPKRALLAVVRGTAPDGGPICATVPPTAVAWSIAESAA